MYRSIIPAKLWKENGFTSYALGAPSVRTYALYYLLEEALKTQKPKVVVMEVIAHLMIINILWEINERLSIT